MNIPRRTIHLPTGVLPAMLEAALATPAERGALLAAFEDAMLRHLGGGHVALVGSGRLGLRLVLEGLGARRVSLPAFTDESVPEAVARANAVALFTDVDRHSMNASVVDPSADTVLVTHLFGAPNALAKNAPGQRIIEDCAHAIDGQLDGRRLGSLGLASFFSFVVTKAVNTFGGGAVWTRDAGLAEHVRDAVSRLPEPPGLFQRVAVGAALNRLTRTRTFSNVGPALLWAADRAGGAVAAYDKTVRRGTMNAHVDTAFSAMQAAAGLVQLRTLPQTQARRHAVAERLVKALPRSLEAQATPAGGTHALYFLVVRCDAPEAVIPRLRSLGVDVGVRPMRNVGGAGFANAAWLEEHTLQLPIHPELDEAAVAHLEGALRRL